MQDLRADVDEPPAKRGARQKAYAPRGFRLGISAPHISVITMLPASALGTPVCHGYSHAALDLFAVPSASKVRLWSISIAVYQPDICNAEPLSDWWGQRALFLIVRQLLCIRDVPSEKQWISSLSLLSASIEVF